MQPPGRQPRLPYNGGDTMSFDDMRCCEVPSEFMSGEVPVLGHEVVQVDMIEENAQSPAAALDVQSPGLVTETNLQPLLESSALRKLVKEVAEELWTKDKKEEAAEEKKHLAERRDDVEIHVEFEANTWSTFYLFFVRLESGKSVFTKFEQTTIWITIIATWFIQGLLIAVIWVHMIENPFNEETIAHMLRYRVLHGQSFSQVETETGKPFMTVFCDEETAPWGWEGEQYEELERYLDGVPPGWALTVLALFGWANCCASEFRSTIEQALATIHLDNPHKTESRKTIHLEEDEMRVVSMSLPRKIAVLVLISFPRLVIMMTLLYTGCQYLCNTASLEDLVLNAMALIFVIEFDELVYAVCATARAQKIVASVQPMRFPVYRLPGGLVVKDLIRIGLMLLAVGLSVTELLMPFLDSARAAKDALCGGDIALSYEASAPLSFIHVLEHDQSFAQCPSSGPEYQSYLKEMYNVALSGENTTRPPDLTAVQDERMRLLLNYVYRDVKPEDQSTMLTLALDGFNAKAGTASSAQPEACSRFDPSMGIDACRRGEGSDSEKACAWPYRSYLCEGWPAFSANKIKTTACASKPTSNLSCALWEMSGHKNPFTFCQAERISGSFTVNYGSMTITEKNNIQTGPSGLNRIIDSEYVYFSKLGQFVGWNGVAGAVRPKGRRLQAKELRAGGGIQVQLQPGSEFERRLGHESEVRFHVNYDILIPFPNTGFIHSTRQIYDDLSRLASKTSSSYARFVTLFEEFFAQLTEKPVSPGCLLVIENVSAPTWTPLGTDLVADRPAVDDTAKCTKACVDVPGWHWKEDDRFNCESFEVSEFCVDGGQGPKWNDNVAPLSSYVDAAGVSVVSACCACGGGTKATNSAARRLNEPALVTHRQENESTSTLFQLPIGAPFTLSGEAAEVGATAGKPVMKPEEHVSEYSVNLMTLLTRLAALEQKNAALESELAGIKSELAGVKAAQQT